MICDPIRWACAASVVGSEVIKIAVTLECEGGPVAAACGQEMILAYSDAEFDRRDRRLQHPPREDCERANASSAANQSIAKRQADRTQLRQHGRNKGKRRGLRQKGRRPAPYQDDDPAGTRGL